MALSRGCRRLTRGAVGLPLPLDATAVKWEAKVFKETISRAPGNHQGYLRLALAMPDTEFTVLRDHRVATKIDLLRHVIQLRHDVADAYLYLAILSPYPVKIRDTVLTPGQLIKRAIALSPHHAIPYYTLAVMMTLDMDDTQHRNAVTTTLEDGTVVSRLDLLAKTVACAPPEPFLYQLVANKLAPTDPPLVLPDGSEVTSMDLYREACKRASRAEVVPFLCQLADSLPPGADPDASGSIELRACDGESVALTPVHLLRKAVSLCTTRGDLCATIARLAEATPPGEGGDVVIEYGRVGKGRWVGAVLGTRLELLKRAVALSCSHYGYYYNLALAMPSDATVELPVAAFRRTARNRSRVQKDGAAAAQNNPLHEAQRAAVRAREIARRAEAKATAGAEGAPAEAVREAKHPPSAALPPQGVGVRGRTQRYTKVDVLIEALTLHDSDPDVYCELAHSLPSYEDTVVLPNGEEVDKLRLLAHAVVCDRTRPEGLEGLAAAMHELGLDHIPLTPDGPVLSLTEVYAQAIQLNPGNPANYNNLGSHIDPDIIVVLEDVAYRKKDLYTKALDLTFSIQPGAKRMNRKSITASRMVAYRNLALSLHPDETVQVQHWRRADDRRFAAPEDAECEGAKEEPKGSSPSTVAEGQGDALRRLLGTAGDDDAPRMVHGTAGRIDLILNAIHGSPQEGMNFNTLGCFLLSPPRGASPDGEAACVNLLDGGVFDSAACFKRAITLTPLQSSPYSNLAWLHPQGDPSPISLEDGVSLTVIELIATAIRLDPHNGSYWHNLTTALPPGAVVAVEGEEHTKASLHLRAVTLAPHNAAYWVNLAHALPPGGTVTVGEEEMTVLMLLKRAVSLEPHKGDLRYNLAVALGDAGDGGGGEEAPGTEASAADADTSPVTVLEDGTLVSQLELLGQAAALSPQNAEIREALRDLQGAVAAHAVRCAPKLRRRRGRARAAKHAANPQGVRKKKPSLPVDAVEGASD
eukprot:TRINITY_DN1474_c0_g2_i2.p1 TRINITY_DN1474_c0_g2~~TRINITY_DN1474_c0_g2_i2.p1  ORF type:complete len:1010 (+),score=270.73 TRINITY_DN1474_c0_g2_i2:86-3031(+)